MISGNKKSLKSKVSILLGHTLNTNRNRLCIFYTQRGKKIKLFKKYQNEHNIGRLNRKHREEILSNSDISATLLYVNKIKAPVQIKRLSDQIKNNEITVCIL